MKRSVTIWTELGVLTTRQRRYPTLAAIESFLQLEGFWRGAVSARNSLYYGDVVIHTEAEAFIHHNAVDNLEILADYAKGKCDIRPTAEYKRWLINGMEVLKCKAS